MKRTISFVVALVMCCSLLLSALPAANAVVMDFIWDQPGQTAPERKVSFAILEQMARAEDDELLRVHVHLRRLPEETIEALVPMTKPSFNVNESTEEERDAWSRAFSETRSRLNRGIVEAFIQRYFEETDPAPSVSGYYSPEFILSANKARIQALAALDEVLWINEIGVSIYPVREPAPQEKLTGTLYEYLQNAGEDERIPVRIWLRGFRTEEYEALNPLPYPTFASTPEELAAYRSAASQASRELNFDYFNPCATFVRNRLNDGELLYQPEMYGIPVIVVKTTAARIAALAKLRIVSQIDPAFGYDAAFPDPELPAEPGQLNKIEARLQEFMTIAAHDELIPIAMSLKEPSQAEIDALRTVSQPGGGATIDEMNTYIHDDRQAKRQVYSALTSAFVENHLDESDEVILRSNYTTSVWAIVPKFKIAELAALEEVREISWALGYDDPAIPADGGETVFLPPEESALSDKIAWPLQVKMTGTADDTPLRVQINLDAPTLEEIKAANPAPEHMTLAEYTAYTNSLTQKYSQARAAVYEPFVQNYLNTAEEQVEAPENYYILATLSKTRIAALANLNEVTSITQWHEQDPMELVLPPEEPGVQAVPEKIEARVQREMNGAAEDEIIGILLWLNAPTHKEIDATVPPPEDPTDPDQVEAFQRAAYRARAATEHGIVEAFVQNHMPGTNELHYAGQDGPYLLAGTTKSRILALTALEEVVRIDREDWPAFPQDDVPQVPTVDPKPPVDPEVLKKLDSYLIEHMEGKPDDAMIPIAVYLDSPSSAEIEAMVPIPQPDVYSAVTMEEVNAYIHAKRAVAWEVNSTITTAFVENYLDENDTVRYAGKAIPVVNCNVPKSKVLSLAALEEVIDIGYAPVVSLYPTWIHDYSEDAIKLTEPLKAYMENLADEEPVAIRVDLRMPTEEIMEMIVPLPKPGEDASQEEIDAYNAAYRQTWREQVSLRTDGFMHYYVHETDPVYYIGEDTATVICEIPVSRLMSAASDQSVIQIDLAGQLADVPAPCEHDYEAVVTAPTCTEGGYTTYTCSKCGDEYVADEVPALGHSFGAWAISKAATCTEKGEQTRACARCDAKETREIAALGHDYNAAVTAPTCTEAGFTTYTCSRCGDKYTGSTTTALGHDYQNGVCTRCGAEDPNYLPSPPPTEVDKSQLVKAIEEYTIPPLNYTYETCKAYNDAYNNAIAVNEKEDASQDEVDAAVSALKAAYAALKPLDYELLLAAIAGAEAIDRSKYDAEALAAMDQALAAAKEARSTLSQSQIDAAAAALEAAVEALSEKQHVHDYTAVVTAPTCTEAGFTTHTCACGDSYVDSEVAALGHDFKDGKCTRCGENDLIYVPPFRFDDVTDESLFYFEPVYWAVDQKITNGTSEKQFSPDKACTRAQVVTMLWRASGSRKPQRNENPFKDVTKDDYYYDAVLWAVEEGITNGVSETAFGPDRTCTRAQIVTFIWRWFGKNDPHGNDGVLPDAFADVDGDAYYADAVLWAVKLKITSGTTPTTFRPDQVCTRGQIVTFLWRAWFARRVDLPE